MMLEAVFAGIASLRKELDELESGNDKITSDEECKTVENAIENNPEEAAAALPEGSDIQKEAEQAIDGGRDAEVNNDAVSKFVGMLSNSPKEDTVITDDGREISRDEYAAEMAQFKEDNPDEILKAKEEAKELARQERAEKRAEDNKLVDMAKEVAGENEADKEDSVIDNAIESALGSIGSRSGSPISMGGASVPNETNELTDNDVNANFSSSATPTVSAEASGGETASTLPAGVTNNIESSNDTASSDTASFSGHRDAVQTNAHKVNVGSSGMLSSAGNGGTVSSGATKTIK